MLCRWVTQSVRNAYPIATTCQTDRGGRSQSRGGRNSKKTGPNWCAKLSNRSGSSVIGPKAVRTLPGVTAIGRLIGSSTSSIPAPPNTWR